MVFCAPKRHQQRPAGPGFMATGIKPTLTLNPEGHLGMKTRSAWPSTMEFPRQKSGPMSWEAGWRERLEGSVEDILRLQVSSMHYFQRPDASHVEVNTAATRSPDGWSFQFASRTQHHLPPCRRALSPGFDPNDAGFQSRDRPPQLFSPPAYQWTKPGRVFQYALSPWEPSLL